VRKALISTAVGLFVLGGFLFLTLTYKKVGKETGGRGGYWVHAFFTDVTGLVEGTQVHIAGRPVGVLKEIDLVQRESGEVVSRVDIWLPDRFKLRKGVQDPETGRWRNATLVARRQASLLGDFYLELSPGTPILSPHGRVMLVHVLRGTATFAVPPLSPPRCGEDEDEAGQVKEKRPDRARIRPEP